MAWSSPGDVATFLFSGSPIAILITLLVALSLPLLLHLYLYRSTASITSPPTFLLLGPSGSGKTSFATLLERLSSQSTSPQPQTRISQLPQTINLSLSTSVPIGSNRYRSENDSSLQSAHTQRFAVVDTPGHGKLRSQHALSLLSPAKVKSDQKLKLNIQGIIFFVDSAFPSGDPHVRDTAEYLYEVLLHLQKRALANGQGRKRKSDEATTDFLIAANKQDLFTALPPGTVKSKLEREIESIRSTRAKGLLDSGVESKDEVDEEEKEKLGRHGSAFGFQSFEEDTGIRIEVVGGSARGDEGAGIRRWEEWIGSCL